MNAHRTIACFSMAEEPSDDAPSLYDQLEEVVLPGFYDDRTAYLDVIRFAIALDGPLFDTHRIIQQYGRKAYL